MPEKKKIDLAVYLVTDRDLALGRSLEWVVEKAVKGGTTMVQLREKDMETKTFIEEAMRMKNLLKAYGVTLLINDRVDVAMAVEADGVHLGQNDMPYEMARKILGSRAIIGLSVETYQQALEADKLDVDYIALSPVYTTPTKEELKEELGLEGVRKITQTTKHPAVGIGSIKAYNAGDVVRAGVNGVAVVSGICSAEDPEAAASELKKAVEKAQYEKR
jgi:thiamine-phosphate pyrophosphorylase